MLAGRRIVLGVTGGIASTQSQFYKVDRWLMAHMVPVMTSARARGHSTEPPFLPEPSELRYLTTSIPSHTPLWDKRQI